MTTRKSAQKWIENILGKKGAKALFRTAEEMAKKRVPAKKIERVIEKELNAHIRERVPQLSIFVANHVDMEP